MERVTAAVKAYLDSQEWRYSYNAESRVFDLKMTAKNYDSTRVLILIHDHFFITYAVLPFKVPEESRLAAAEFVTRANYGLNIGNLEMDMEDGEVRYKSSICCDDDSVPSMKVIERTVDLAYLTLDKYAKGLLRLIYGGMSAEDAVAVAENK